MNKKLFVLIIVLALCATAMLPAAAQEVVCTHTVVAGDTLISVAGKYGFANWRTIQSANGLPNSNIVVGQVLQLPFDACNARNQAAPVNAVIQPVAGQIGNLDQATLVEVQRLAADQDAPATVIQYLDRRWQMAAAQGGFLGNIGSWDPSLARDGVQIEGPAFIWTDFFKATNVPAGVTAVSTAGFWGVFQVADGVTAVIPESSNGGRWVSLEIPLNAQAELAGTPNTCTGVSTVLTALVDLDPQSAVGYMDSNPTATTHYFNNESLDVPAGSSALIWRDWGAFEAVPQGVTPATMSSTVGGYGVWLVEGPAQFTLPNGGATIYACGAINGG